MEMAVPLILVLMAFVNILKSNVMNSQPQEMAYAFHLVLILILVVTHLYFFSFSLLFFFPRKTEHAKRILTAQFKVMPALFHFAILILINAKLVKSF